MRMPEIIVAGKDNGEGMVIHYETRKGTDIFGLAVPNMHVDVDWDLGPTWCYLINGSKTTLIDTGRPESLDSLEGLLGSVERKLSDIDRIIVTHSHEDHDGNLADIVATGQIEVWAHPIYERLIAYHPDILDGASRPELPGSCRLCTMPESFRRNCLPYLEKRSMVGIDVMLDKTHVESDDSLRFIFTPGHTADSICIVLEDEILFTGDTVLHDITPHPSTVSAFDVNRRILPEQYRERNTVYGLITYLNSLRKISSLPPGSFGATFPAHRLYYNAQFNLISNPSERAREIIQFHIDRCRDILHILGTGSLSIEEIAQRHFDPSLLTGMGKFAANREIMAHIEVLDHSGDVCRASGNQHLFQSTGSANYLNLMGEYLK